MSICDSCVNFVLDDELQEYFCDAPIDEDEMSKEAIQSIKEKIFKTRTGINYINHLYL